MELQTVISNIMYYIIAKQYRNTDLMWTLTCGMERMKTMS